MKYNEEYRNTILYICSIGLSQEHQGFAMGKGYFLVQILSESLYPHVEK